MITVLTGGTGGCKLIDGLIRISRIDPFELHLIVNTADDMEISGNLVCPDLDSVLYTLSGDIDTDTWFGIEDDTYSTHRELINRTPAEDYDPYLAPDRQTMGRSLARHRRFSGRREFMKIGDRDRSTHIMRSSLIDEGANLTTVMEIISNWFGIDSSLLPMSNDPVSTIIHTEDEEYHLQEYWVEREGEPEVKELEYRGIENARPTGAVSNALSHPVIIAPSNPLSSINPILELPGIRDQLREVRVLAVSPFLGEEVFSGPANDFLEARGFPAGTKGMLELYDDILDGVVLHEDDPTYTSLPVFRTQTAMDDAESRKKLAHDCVMFLYRLL